jgi:hypothetical protein
LTSEWSALDPPASKLSCLSEDLARWKVPLCHIIDYLADPVNQMRRRSCTREIRKISFKKFTGRGPRRSASLRIPDLWIRSYPTYPGAMHPRMFVLVFTLVADLDGL